MRRGLWVRWLGMGLALLMLLTSVAVGQPPQTRAQGAQPDIVFIVVDALRPDHLSAYGYGRPTSPAVDSLLAAQGVRFSDVTAASSWTNPANGAMLLSRLPSQVDTVWADHQGRIPATETLLAEYLSAAGYRTAGFVSNWWMTERFGYAQGFDAYLQTEGPEKERAAVLNELAWSWLDLYGETLQEDERPLFLFLYYYDPHTWYDPPSPYDTLYDPAYAGPLTAEVFGHGHSVVSGEITPSPRDVEHLLALYDGEISYWDSELGRMAAYLDGMGLWQDSLIVLTSDHGQMFGEHGKWVHRNSLYEEVLRVPLIIRYPAVVPAGQLRDTPVSNMDILPTILDLAGVEVPAGLAGQSLRPLLLGAPFPARPIVAEMAGEPDPRGDAFWIAPRTDLYSIRQDGWKYTHALQNGPEDTLVEVGRASVYEGPNLIAQQPERAGAMWAELRQIFGIPTEFLFLPAVKRP